MSRFDLRVKSLSAISWLLPAAALLLFAVSAWAQDAVQPPSNSSTHPDDNSSLSPTQLKKLQLEELINTEITSASRRPEPLSHASSAVDVLTGDEIERAGATNIPDALRLAPEVQVAQVNGNTWGISARGFNNTTANKMQVLMDGRNLYTPLYSGVFWDVQQTFMPDLQQIEIVRGPGATLWGADAVNGVINIITKSAKDTQGLLIYGGGGDELLGFGGLRYGDRIGQDTYYRAYIMHQSRDGLHIEGDGDSDEDTNFTQGGFRIDSQPSSQDLFTLQGDAYSGAFGKLDADDTQVDGQNIIGRWTRQFESDSSLMLQAYYDRTRRLVPSVFEEVRNTFDIELQRRFVAGNHDLLFGANYRVSHDDIGNLGPTLAFIPDEETAQLVSGYAQDEWHIVPNQFYLTLGSKFEYNTFSGFEYQPSVRFTWLPTPNQTVWGAISRAVRTPTRIDQNFFVPNPSSNAPSVLVANPDFDSEELIAYELGYRVRPTEDLSIDLAAYYNDYDDLRSLEPLGLTRFPATLSNMLEATGYGGALTIKWRPVSWWEVTGGASALHLDFTRKTGSRNSTGPAAEGNDPNWMAVAHSMLDLPWRMKFDTVFRFVDELSDPVSPAYFTIDARLAWSPTDHLELALVGRDLLDDHHPEFRGLITQEVERSIFATVKWSY